MAVYFLGGGAVGIVLGITAYCAGHWRGYDKGYADCKEYLHKVHNISKGW